MHGWFAGQFGFEGYIVSDCGGVADLGNRRYPASQQCIANINGTPHNDNQSGCFLPPLPAKGQTVAGVAMNAGCAPTNCIVSQSTPSSIGVAVIG